MCCRAGVCSENAVSVIEAGRQNPELECRIQNPNPSEARLRVVRRVVRSMRYGSAIKPGWCRRWCACARVAIMCWQQECRRRQAPLLAHGARSHGTRGSRRYMRCLLRAVVGAFAVVRDRCRLCYELPPPCLLMLPRGRGSCCRVCRCLMRVARRLCRDVRFSRDGAAEHAGGMPRKRVFTEFYSGVPPL